MQLHSHANKSTFGSFKLYTKHAHIHKLLLYYVSFLAPKKHIIAKEIKVKKVKKKIWYKK